MLQRIGRYEILERIAAGGQGTVYRARDTALDRVIAVKILNQPVTDDPLYLEALQREFTLAASGYPLEYLVSTYALEHLDLFMDHKRLK